MKILDARRHFSWSGTFDSLWLATRGQGNSFGVISEKEKLFNIRGGEFSMAGYFLEQVGVDGMLFCCQNVVIMKVLM